MFCAIVTLNIEALERKKNKTNFWLLLLMCVSAIVCFVVVKR